MMRAERAEQTHFQHAHFLAAREQLVHHFFAGAAGGAHQNNDPFGLRVAVIFKRLVLAARGGGEIVHRLPDMVIDRVIPGVGRLAGLEIGVRVGGGAANDRVFRVQRAGAVGVDLRLRQQRADRLIGQRRDFVDLVRGAKPIEEMNKRHAAFQRGDMGNQREILRLLDAARTEHRAARLAHGHDVRVIAKNRQRMGGDGARRDVQHKWRELARELVKRRDHQQQALGRGERRGERAGLERAVDGGDSARLGLHLHHARHVAPDVFHAVARPGIGLLRHGGTRCDGVNRDNFTGAKSD
ncbi:hypothetical protein BN133_2212 [Cronobacter dublinensis 582]|nr:hypothetical protein BN133_2212 [Cronobacter dublinensis 582]